MNPNDLFDLRGRSALITGSSRGIGKAFALALTRAGARVALHASSPHGAIEDTAKMIRALGGECITLAADLAAEDAPQRIVQETRAAFGAIDILVCNASVQLPENWLETSAAHFATQVNVNLRSTFALMQLVAPQMTERKWGRIVTVGSVQETKPHPQMTVYAATKCAQTSLVRSLAPQLADSGVTVNNIAPGVIETDRNTARLADERYKQIVLEKIPAARTGTPEDCVGALLLLCSEAGSYITGQSIYVDGGMGL